ncbi:uncharacterized protein LOC121875002 [Homarus americanus]|uniref:uncharacterized protein LOC121872199 n=1 Tax=Homarus americanus TaxID=6706 RepID=UPI001C44B293|nr:uncharacterized protein LOC121872199 [Homarus americanus]XP_042235293.1 uncharacterized protein LOC121875002 [Homarus americanus]
MALESLAMNTGGKTYSVLDEDDGGMLDEAFLGALTYQPGQSLSNISVKIHEMEYHGANLTVYSTFNVDSSVGRKLQFRLDMDSTNHITSNPYLVSPNGTRITTAVLDSIINMWTIDVALAQVK